MGRRRGAPRGRGPRELIRKKAEKRLRKSEDCERAKGRCRGVHKFSPPHSTAIKCEGVGVSPHGTGAGSERSRARCERLFLHGYMGFSRHVIIFIPLAFDDSRMRTTGGTNERAKNMGRRRGAPRKGIRGSCLIR